MSSYLPPNRNSSAIILLLAVKIREKGSEIRSVNIDIQTISFPIKASKLIINENTHVVPCMYFYFIYFFVCLFLYFLYFIVFALWWHA